MVRDPFHQIHKLEFDVADAEREAILRGTLSPDETAYHNGSWVEKGELKSNSDFVWSTLAMASTLFTALIIMAGISQALMAFVPTLESLSPLTTTVIAIIATPLLAQLFYRWREVTQKVPFALAEISLGMVIVGNITFHSPRYDDLATWLSLVAGMFVAIDGRTRLAHALSRQAKIDIA